MSSRVPKDMIGVHTCDTLGIILVAGDRIEGSADTVEWVTRFAWRPIDTLPVYSDGTPSYKRRPVVVSDSTGVFGKRWRPDIKALCLMYVG